MKKTSILLLLGLCLLLPQVGAAEGLAQLAVGVGEGMSMGLREGVRLASAVKSEDLTLELTTSGARLEEGQKLTVTVTAGNPREEAVPVVIDMKLPERLAASMETTWQALLPAGTARADGSIEPSVTTFTREIAIVSGTLSEQMEIEAEMSMGTRFYRARTVLNICMSDVSVRASVEDAPNARVEPGDMFSYLIEVSNAGAAAKDVPLEMMLPADVRLVGELPGGFVLEGGMIVGQVRAEAAQTAEKASMVSIKLPVQVNEHALEGDEDASALLTGELHAQGERLAMPRVQVCAPCVSARLVPEADKLEAGEEMDLRILVVNAGLADAEVELSCVLPEGLTLLKGDMETVSEATPDEAMAMDGDDGAKPAAAVAIAEPEQMAVFEQGENNTLIFHLHMDAAKEDASGVTASTKTLLLRVRAEELQEKMDERMLGTALCWSTDDGRAQLGEAVALKVYEHSLLGVSKEEWSGVFWAGILLVVTVIALYSAVHSREGEEDYCME